MSSKNQNTSHASLVYFSKISEIITLIDIRNNFQKIKDYGNDPDLYSKLNDDVSELLERYDKDERSNISRKINLIDHRIAFINKEILERIDHLSIIMQNPLLDEHDVYKFKEAFHQPQLDTNEELHESPDIDEKLDGEGMNIQNTLLFFTLIVLAITLILSNGFG